MLLGSLTFFNTIAVLLFFYLMITKSTKLDALLGTVALVGAGPGDPELLTIQASKLIQNAQLVISDRLVSSEILQLVNCELRIARKAPGCANEAQNDVNFGQICQFIDNHFSL